MQKPMSNNPQRLSKHYTPCLQGSSDQGVRTIICGRQSGITNPSLGFGSLLARPTDKWLGFNCRCPDDTVLSSISSMCGMINAPWQDRDMMLAIIVVLVVTGVLHSYLTCLSPVSLDLGRREFGKYPRNLSENSPPARHEGFPCNVRNVQTLEH